VCQLVKTTPTTTAGAKVKTAYIETLDIDA
jgi:hypothetical protein